MTRYSACIAGLLSSLLSMLAAPAQAQRLGLAPLPLAAPYTVRDLGVVSNEQPIGCLANNGQFFGTRRNSATGGVDRPFTPGSQGTDFYLYYTPGVPSWVNGCNGNAEAVGVNETAAVWDVDWSAPQRLFGGDGAWGTVPAEATAINAARQVVGYVSTGTAFLTHDAMLWETSTVPNDAAVTVTRLAKDANAWGINDAGEIVGECAPGPGGATRACYFSAGTHTRRDFPLSTTGAARDINTLGWAIGYHSTTKGMRGFHWLPATGLVSELMPITSYSLQRYKNAQAFALNDAGVTVGASWDDNQSHHATIWPGDGTSRDLNSAIDYPGIVLTEARDINASGVVLCEAYKDGQRHAVLLTPSRGRWFWVP